VLLTYVDESYTSSRYYIAALMVPEYEAKSLSEALDNVMAKVERDFEIPRETELHGHELINGKGAWSPLAHMVRARIGVYDDAMEAIGSHTVSIILRGMDVDRQKARYSAPDPPHEVVLGHLIERVDEHAERAGELTIMIADEISDSERHQRKLWQYQRFSTDGYRARKITQFVDTIHFVPSRSSRLLQAADLVAHLHRRRETHTETNEKSRLARERMWSHVAPRVRHSLCWYP
jgi:hypothetical protein